MPSLLPPALKVQGGGVTHPPYKEEAKNSLFVQSNHFCKLVSQKDHFYKFSFRPSLSFAYIEKGGSVAGSHHKRLFDCELLPKLLIGPPLHFFLPVRRLMGVRRPSHRTPFTYKKLPFCKLNCHFHFRLRQSVRMGGGTSPL